MGKKEKKWREKSEESDDKENAFFKLLCSTFRYQNELQVIQGQ